MKDKSPLIVKQSIEFLQASIKQTFIDDLNKIYTEISSDCSKLAAHPDGEIREMGLATMGLLKARVGAGVEKYLSDLNPQKLEKVNEAAAEYKLTKYDKPKKAKKKAAPKVDNSGDAVMEIEDEAPKPKKKAKKGGGPPASFLNRQKDMQEKASDKFEELKAELNGEAPPPKKSMPKDEPMEEEKAAPPKVASNPPAAKARPKTAKPAGKKPKIQVEDTGPGVSKEEARGIIEEKVPSEVVKQFEETKWQDKKEAYTKLAAWLNEQEYSNENFEATFWFIKIQMKEWKEKNVNIVKSALSCISDIVKEADCLSKRSATIIIPFLSESVGDPKYKELCKELLLSLAELVGPGFLIKHMCKHTSNAKAPNVIVENNAVMAMLIDEFGTDGLPVQEMINIGIIC